jgi:hypothetical protein
MSETNFDPSELDHDPITMQPFIPGAGTHVPPPGADWTEHTAGLDCLAHMESGLPFPGRIVGRRPTTEPYAARPAGPAAPADDLPF